MPGWSLSNEAFFYVCFPFVGVALSRSARLRSLILTGFCICLLGAVGPLLLTVISPDPTSNLSHFLQYNPLLNLPDFCAGIVLERIYRILLRQKPALRGYWLYVPAISSELLLLAFPKTLPHLFDVLRLPLHCLIILGLALGTGPLARWLSVRQLVFLGNASYAIYIFHVPVVHVDEADREAVVLRRPPRRRGHALLCVLRRRSLRV